MAAPSKLPKAKLLRAPSLLPGCVLPSELPRLCSPTSSRGSPGLLPAVFSLASFLGSILPGHGWLRPWPDFVFPGHGWLRPWPDSVFPGHRRLRPWPGSPFSMATWTRLPTASICSSRCIASALRFSLVFSQEGLNFECPTSQQAPDPLLPSATFSLSSTWSQLPFGVVRPRTSSASDCPLGLVRPRPQFPLDLGPTPPRTACSASDLQSPELPSASVPPRTALSVDLSCLASALVPPRTALSVGLSCLGLGLYSHSNRPRLLLGYVMNNPNLIGIKLQRKIK